MQAKCKNLFCKHSLSWKLINDVTGRKTIAQGQLEGDTQAERVRNWYSHFYNLLGKPPTVDDEDEEIKQIFPKLNIKQDVLDLMDPNWSNRVVQHPSSQTPLVAFGGEPQFGLCKTSYTVFPHFPN